MSHRNHVIAICTFVVLLLGFGSLPVHAADKTFTLGVLGPLTGPGGAKMGNELKDGATMAFEEIDYTIGDYKVELVFIDDQSDPAKGTNAYAEAIERKGVQAGILNWNTAVTVAIQKMLLKYKVPHFFNMGAGKAGNDMFESFPPEDRYLIMKGWPIPQKLVVGYVDFLNDLETKGIWVPQQKVAALWGEDTDWGRSLVGGLAEGLKKNGWEIFTEEYFDYKKTDFYPFVNKCKKAGVTLMAGSSSGAGVSALLKQSQEIGFHPVQIADGLGWTGDWFKMTGMSSNGVLDMIPQFTRPEQKDWVERFKKRFGYTPSPSAAGQGYDYAKYFVKIADRAIAKYGTLDSETVTRIGREEVQTGELKYSTADGALMHAAYGTDPDNCPDPTIGVNDFFFPVLQYKNGQGYAVFPENMKEADFIAPK